MGLKAHYPSSYTCTTGFLFSFFAEMATGYENKASVKIDYYKADETSASDLESMCKDAVSAIAADEECKKCKLDDCTAVVAAVLRLGAVEKFLLHISRVQIFNHDVHSGFAHNLELLGLLKKLKYFYVLPQSAFLHSLSAASTAVGVQVPELAAQAESALAASVQAKVKVVCQKETMQTYLDNEKVLEKAEPHAVYPTSEYRSCDGQVLATEDASLIEGVMSTTISTTIRIVSGVLSPENLTLRDVYAPKGRCIAVVDDHVESLYGDRIDGYFAKHSIPLTKLVCSGMEAGKSMA